MKRLASMLSILTLAAGLVSAQVGGVRVDVTLDQEQFLSNEDVRVAVRVTNHSGQSLQLGQGDDWLTFSIVSRGKFMARETSPPPVDGAFTLNSSQTGTKRVNLTPYFDFREPDRYEIVATVRIPQWDQELSSPPVVFEVIRGSKLREVEFGVPRRPGEEGVPEVRKYVLQQANYLRELQLYVRVTDATETHVFKTLPIARMISFSHPETQLDSRSRLHVLHQTGARAFNYCVIDPDGRIVARQTHDYTNTRPTLRVRGGDAFVQGGVRRVSASDFPAPPTSISSTEKDVHAPLP